MIQLKVKKLKSSATIPTFGTSEAACFDLYSAEDYHFYPGDSIKVSTGLQFDIPTGFELQIRPRSGLTAKTKLRVGNSPGTVDADYLGEVLVIMDNIGTNSMHYYKVSRGDRIAQACLVPVVNTELVEVDKITKVTNRGAAGIGSTGV